ncbi:hypothetical protein LIER_15127 [Lithospermum erythrorhizon]|uniref:Uncharacterized protein n=1 Tax=Lithospermum erythrorhizon TaxID=34254 RepID=A0AAV3Q2N2_LITER
MPFTDRLDGVPLPKGSIYDILSRINIWQVEKALVLETPLSKNELIARVRQFVKLEELKNKEDKTKDLRKILRKRGRSKSPKKALVWERIQRDMRQSSKRRNYEPLPQKGLVQCMRKPNTDRLTPLRVSIAEIYFQIEGKNLLPKLVRMGSAPDRRDKTRYFKYHREHGYHTNECKILNVEIENLIKQGYLKEFMEKGTQRDVSRKNCRSPPPPRIKPKRWMCLDSRGKLIPFLAVLQEGDDSQNSRKNYARKEGSGYNGVNNQSLIHSGGHNGFFIQWADRMPHTNPVKGNSVRCSPQAEVPYSRRLKGGMWQSKESKKMLSDICATAEQSAQRTGKKAEQGKSYGDKHGEERSR